MSLEAALDSVVGNVTDKFSVGTMKASMMAWNASWPLSLNELSRPERTVRDWYVPSQVVELSIQSIATPTDLQNTISVIVRTIEAAIVARNKSRITGAQALAIETLYFLVWP